MNKNELRTAGYYYSGNCQTQNFGYNQYLPRSSYWRYHLFTGSSSNVLRSKSNLDAYCGIGKFGFFRRRRYGPLGSGLLQTDKYDMASGFHLHIMKRISGKKEYSRGFNLMPIIK